MTTLAQAKRRTALISAGVALAMIGLAYASVPLYRAFCNATGYGGTTTRAEAGDLPTPAQLQALGGRTIKIRFDSNVAPGLGWNFGPRDRERTVKIGARNLTFFAATNATDKALTGRATFNVSPDTAGAYFRKIECFCFTEQTLAAGETAQMPVTFYVDPAILNDPDAKKIDEITLSYTFFPVDNPGPAAVSRVAQANSRQPSKGAS